MLNTFIILTLAFALTLAALIDIARKDFGSVRMKIIWWIVASVPVIGSLVYLIFGFRRGKPVR